jgi:phage tail-like protein
MPAPTFSANAHRFDPYRTFKFQCLIDGRPVAGLQKMGALKKTTEQVKWRSAGDPSHQRVIPGGTSYEAVTLEQGLTHDPVFEQWANLVNNIEGDGGVSLLNYRKDIVINVLNLQGQVAISYKLLRAWVSEFQALPELDSNSMSTMGIQTLTLQHEGWERDTAVSEPTES